MTAESDADATAPARPVAIVGAGAVGTALGRRLAERGRRATAVVSRTEADAEALAGRIGAGVASDDPAAIPEDVGFVFVCVPDDAIAPVAEALAGLDRSWTGVVVAHTSGARTADALAALRPAGAALLSFHPVQTFPENADPRAFEGIAVTLQGDEAAVEAGINTARVLGAHPVRLSAEDKARVHCAASLASNGLVAVAGAARRMLDAAGIEEDEAGMLLRPLIRQTCANLEDDRPETALTGPVVRGDRGTVEAHLDALAGAAPDLQPLYRALATEMIRLGRKSGRLDEGGTAAVRDALSRRESGRESGGDAPLDSS